MDSPPGTSYENKSEEVQAQVDEVLNIMQVNVKKVLERETEIQELDTRATDLFEKGKGFEKQAQKLRRSFWCKNFEMWVILGIMAVLAVPVVIVIVFMSSSSDGGNSTNFTVTNPETN